MTPPDLLISNANLIDGTGAPARTTSLLVRGGKVHALGAEAEAAPDVARFDASGLSVMPGLIDSHVHCTFDDAAGHDELFYHRRPGMAAITAARNVRKMLTAGVTGFFDADSLFDLGVDLKEAIQYGVIEGPRMAVGGYALMTSVGGAAGRLMPDTGTMAYARMVRGKDEIVAEVRRQIKIGCDWIKVHVTGSFAHRRSEGEFVTFTMEELRTICDVAHDFGVSVAGHCRGAKSIRMACEAGFDQIIHATQMDDAALEALLKRKAFIVPALTFQANLMEFGDAIAASPAMQEIFRREIADSAEMFHKAFKAGVPMACGSESGFSVTPYGDWHYREMEVYVRHFGLTPLEAIQCCTQSGALALRMQGQVGTLEPGRLADLLVVDGDPSRDLTVLGRREKLRMVMLGGRSIDLTRQEPERRPMPEWRCHDFGSILTKEIVDRSRQAAPADRTRQQ
ncbi:MAG TPA: amidohydrolase family protein [Ramlibacter sp.]|nr:amidohydrolase family protein [Ramlibacter sp.]